MNLRRVELQKLAAAQEIRDVLQERVAIRDMDERADLRRARAHARRDCPVRILVELVPEVLQALLHRLAPVGAHEHVVARQQKDDGRKARALRRAAFLHARLDLLLEHDAPRQPRMAILLQHFLEALRDGALRVQGAHRPDDDADARAEADGEKRFDSKVHIYAFLSHGSKSTLRTSLLSHGANGIDRCMLISYNYHIIVFGFICKDL